MTTIEPLHVAPKRTAWRDLRHAALGVGLGLSVMVFVLASAEEEAIEPRPRDAVQKTVMDLGHYICREHQGIASVTNLDGQIMRFRCRTGTVIEERVIIK